MFEYLRDSETRGGMHKKSNIILVDDDSVNLVVGKNALSDEYDVLTIPSGEKLLTLLQTIHPDLILLDIAMPDMDGYEVLQKIKENESTSDIPVMFLTAKCDAESELHGLTLGAVDYITKPFSPPLLKKRIETLLLFLQQKKTLQKYNNNLQSIVQEKTKTVVELQNVVLNTVAELVEYRDNITGAHIGRTQDLLKYLLDEMIRQGVYSSEIVGWDLSFILPSSQLHDVGKIIIPDSILKKPGRLTDEEFELMKQHPLQGAKIIETIQKSTTEHAFLQHAKTFALYHHEKWNGSGYPYGLKGEDIPLQGRLMAVVDVYDALVSERSYKKQMSHDEAKHIIIEESGSHFDPRLVEVFEKVEDKFEEAIHSSIEEVAL